MLAVAVCALLLGSLGSDARADERLAELARTLASSQHEKARIAAAVALGRLEDPRSLEPLVRGLDDASHVVRAVAATALGRLGDARALPALRRAASDRDELVRRRATAAIERIGTASRARPRSARRAPVGGDRRPASYAISAREAPRRAMSPELYVVVRTTTDSSRGRARPNVRRQRADHVRRLMVRELQRERSVTLEQGVASELGIDGFSLDLTISKLSRNVSGAMVEIECEIRVAVSNGRGKMISFLTGGARVQVPATSFRGEHEGQLQREAMENAVRSIHRDLVTYLKRNPS